MNADRDGRVRRALEGDSSLLVTRAVPVDDIHIRKGGTGRDVIAYAAVWMTPAEIMDQEGHYREQNLPTSMDKSIKERSSRIFSAYNHGKTLFGTPSDTWSVPIGRPIEMRADSKGLYTVTRYNTDPESDRILEAVRSGSITGMSYTGVFVSTDPPLTSAFDQYRPDRNGDLTLVTRQEIALIEYGPTPTPAFEDAEIIGVRSRLIGSGADPGPEPGPARESITVQAAAAPETADRALTTEDIPHLAAGKTANSDGPGDDGEKPAAQTAAAPDPGRDPAPETTRTEPQPHSAAPIRNQNRRTSVDNDRQSYTVEERAARQSEIRSRLAELDTEYSGAELPQEARAEWTALQEEMVVHERSIADANSRADYLRYINDNNIGATERVDNQRAGYGTDGGGFAARMGGSGPSFVQSRDIYDLAAIRNRARHIDEVPTLYRDYAQRAVEQARFPGATGRRGAPNREEAQERVSLLLDTIDDEHGSLARRILVTGSPTYERAFGKMLARQSVNGLTAEESRSLSLGTDSAGGYAVPFQLDPTVILTSNGVVNPLRQISRVETITGKEWDGVTSAGVTVTRGTEGQEVGTGDPAFAQPTVRTSRVQGWVPFSVELDVTWNALRTQLTSLLQDAKDVEEATAFATGNGTAPNPSGVVSTLGTASWVDTAGSAVLAAGDVYLLENAMAPRFISNSSIVASKTTFNRFRSLFQAQASSAGDPFSRPSGGMGEMFNGYPKYELSTMSTSIGTGSLVMLQGDFQQFLIVDRVGMGIELVPHVLGSNRRPTGERGVFALWFNSSKILADNAFRLLRIKST
jgi:HK97 family phage major capsid protein/HK97 family phage prohead protease